MIVRIPRLFKRHKHDHIPLAKLLVPSRIVLDCACGSRKIMNREQFTTVEITFPKSATFRDKCLIDASAIEIPATLA